MSRGNSGRIVIEIDPALKRELHSVLALEGVTLKECFISYAENYIKQHSQQPRSYAPKNENERP